MKTRLGKANEAAGGWAGEGPLRRRSEIKREALEREKRVDERVEKLVIAIGELVSRMPPPAPQTS